MRAQIVTVLFGLLLAGCYGYDEGDDRFNYEFAVPSAPANIEVLYAEASHPYHVNVGYAAEPDYSYHYPIMPGNPGNAQTHKVTRNGDKVEGEFKKLQPDGTYKIVRYTKDPKKGFKATVDYTPV